MQNHWDERGPVNARSSICVWHLSFSKHSYCWQLLTSLNKDPEQYKKYQNCEENISTISDLSTSSIWHGMLSSLTIFVAWITFNNAAIRSLYMPPSIANEETSMLFSFLKLYADHTPACIKYYRLNYISSKFNVLLHPCARLSSPSSSPVWFQSANVLADYTIPFQQTRWSEIA